MTAYTKPPPLDPYDNPDVLPGPALTPRPDPVDLCAFNPNLQPQDHGLILLRPRSPPSSPDKSNNQNNYSPDNNNHAPPPTAYWEADMTSNRSSAQPSPSRGGSAGEPGPSTPAPDRQTHSTHIFEVPYRKAADADRQKQTSRPSSPPPPSQQPASSSTPSNNKPPPKITPIPRIVPTGSLRYDPPGSEDPPPPKPRHETLAQGLEGRYVDEFGNVLDWDGTVLGRVEGDLPSMVGRPVSQNGEILDTDGDVVGYVSDNYIQPERQELGNGLQVDGEGNIYNQDGAVIGKLNEPPNKDAKSSWPAKQRAEAPPPPPKPASAPNPSEIYLDVKSTFDGIQIIMKIPTIFNREHDCAEHDKEKTEEERVKYEDRPRENGDSSHQ